MNELKPATRYTSTSLHEAVKLRLDEPGSFSQGVVPHTIPQFFAEVCEKYPELPALEWETPGAGVDGWTTLNYRGYQKQVEQAALMLLSVGLEERSSLGILAFNCPEWFFAELGALRAGAVVAGIYPSNSAEAVYHVLATGESTVCVVDDAQQMAKLRAIKKRLPRLKAVIQLHGPFGNFVDQEPGYFSWQNLQERTFSKELKEELKAREGRVYANECAMLIFTSGTVGFPKAVMLSHDNIIFEGKSAKAFLENMIIGSERLVSYLPLSHVAAQITDLMFGLICAGCVTFADKDALKGTLIKTFRKARPTAIFGVPRVFEKMQERLVAAEAKANPLSRLLLALARASVAEYRTTLIEGKTPSMSESVKYWLASRLVKRIREIIGLDHCRYILTGSAPVSVEVKQFFLSLDMPLGECYGMSESGGIVSMNVGNQMSNLHSAGPTMKGLTIKVQDSDGSGQGEILMRGRTIFMGYLGLREKTEEVIKEDGWLHSGDLGYIDPKGNLVISGRLKELIITAGGENIPPVQIEDLIKKELPCVSNVLLVGDHRKYLTVLLSLKTKSDATTGIPLDALREETVEWLRDLDIHETSLSSLLNIPSDLRLPNDAAAVSAALDIIAEPKLLEALEEGIKRANKNAISNAQRVQKFALIPHEFSLATGELGPTLKIRRSIVHDKYAKVIDLLYK
ncbi:long-chain-fatty-acid--CoA ligase heimdall-like [Drosophila kikkawai]|uniref:long-chain-fatty-acid--CoA ligase n=1 Tax=Drosophila kikkawai TaxID=30033 RepID=A0A6P4ILA5_DROKI|nr:long-chain-fatty-acid--CoA ligase heimdall-like [Drosophila kikkawai]